ncbi:hypothetical protein EJ06DRAFT_528112 [Trichodelitschia bisporula]|uniref:Telomeric single stranded DNA binding POT1/Cdc13 domain-containing protein n=1 Tax=Trichodelitschia bisporula TaxID=703511 RepID=A0A6G1I4C6_9PEZI|nr:hypothetical protein EJ06DRAFT_528112 [Trichodelitschia bisporula]
MAVVPIATLNPTAPLPRNTTIRAVVSLLWPYSPSTRAAALLLVEPDFRLRHQRGQVRVQFTGASAQAVARSGVNIGDEVFLSLEGGVWVEPQNGVQTPGKSVEGDIRFKSELVMKIVREGRDSGIEVAAGSRDSTPELEVEPTTPAKLATPAPRISFGTPATVAFHKRARISGHTFVDSPYDPFVDDNRSSKRMRLSWGGSTWRMEDRVPSPQKGRRNILFGVDLDSTDAMDVGTPTPTSPAPENVSPQLVQQITPPLEETSVEHQHDAAKPDLMDIIDQYVEDGEVEHNLTVGQAAPSTPTPEHLDIDVGSTPQLDQRDVRHTSLAPAEPASSFFELSPQDIAAGEWALKYSEMIGGDTEDDEYEEPLKLRRRLAPEIVSRDFAYEQNVERASDVPEHVDRSEQRVVVATNRDSTTSLGKRSSDSFKDDTDTASDTSEVRSPPKKKQRSAEPEMVKELSTPAAMTTPSTEVVGPPREDISTAADSLILATDSSDSEESNEDTNNIAVPAAPSPPHVPEPIVRMQPPSLPQLRTSTTPLNTSLKSSSSPHSPDTPSLQPLLSATLPLPSPFPGNNLTSSYFPRTTVRVSSGFLDSLQPQGSGIMSDLAFQFGFGFDEEINVDVSEPSKEEAPTGKTAEDDVTVPAAVAHEATSAAMSEHASPAAEVPEVTPHSNIQPGESDVDHLDRAETSPAHSSDIEESIEQITEESIEQITEESIEQVTEESAKKVTKESFEQTTEEPLEQTTEEPIEQTTEESFEQTAEESIEQITEESVERVTEESVERITEESFEQTAEESLEQITEVSIEQITDDSIEEITEESVEQITEESLEQTTGETLEQITEESLEQTTETPAVQQDEAPLDVHEVQSPHAVSVDTEMLDDTPLTEAKIMDEPSAAATVQPAALASDFGVRYPSLPPMSSPAREIVTRQTAENTSHFQYPALPLVSDDHITPEPPAAPQGSQSLVIDLLDSDEKGTSEATESGEGSESGDEELDEESEEESDDESGTVSWNRRHLIHDEAGEAGSEEDDEEDPSEDESGYESDSVAWRRQIMIRRGIDNAGSEESDEDADSEEDDADADSEGYGGHHSEEALDDEVMSDIQSNGSPQAFATAALDPGDNSGRPNEKSHSGPSPGEEEKSESEDEFPSIDALLAEGNSSWSLAEPQTHQTETQNLLEADAGGNTDDVSMPTVEAPETPPDNAPINQSQEPEAPSQRSERFVSPDYPEYDSLPSSESDSLPVTEDTPVQSQPRRSYNLPPVPLFPRLGEHRQDEKLSVSASQSSAVLSQTSVPGPHSPVGIDPNDEGSSDVEAPQSSAAATLRPELEVLIKPGRVRNSLQAMVGEGAPTSSQSYARTRRVGSVILSQDNTSSSLPMKYPPTLEMADTDEGVLREDSSISTLSSDPVPEHLASEGSDSDAPLLSARGKANRVSHQVAEDDDLPDTGQGESGEEESDEVKTGEEKTGDLLRYRYGKKREAREAVFDEISEDMKEKVRLQNLQDSEQSSAQQSIEPELTNYYVPPLFSGESHSIMTPDPSQNPSLPLPSFQPAQQYQSAPPLTPQMTQSQFDSVDDYISQMLQPEDPPALPDVLDSFNGSQTLRSEHPSPLPHVPSSPPLEPSKGIDSDGSKKQAEDSTTASSLLRDLKSQLLASQQSQLESSQVEAPPSSPPSESTKAAFTHFSRTVSQARGLVTPMGYYTPLPALVNHINTASQFDASVDVLAVVTSVSDINRAKKGRRHHFVTVKVTDEASWPHSVGVKVYRPWKDALPKASVGDVILLRDFAVKSTKGGAGVAMESTNGSSWCVWRLEHLTDSHRNGAKAGSMEALQRVEEATGPPVEIGREERKAVRERQLWWMRLPEKGKAK